MFGNTEAIQSDILCATNQGFVVDMHTSVLIIPYYVEMMMDVSVQGGIMEPELSFLLQETSFQDW